MTDTPSSPAINVEKTHLISEHALPSPLTACCWDPKNRFIFVGTEEHGVRRFQFESKESVRFVGPHDSWVRAIGVSPDGEVTYTGGYDGRLVWWPTTAAADAQPIRSVDAHQGWIRALAVSPDGKTIATCGNDKRVRLWDAQTGTLLKTFEDHQSHVYNVAFAPAGDALVACDLHGFVKVWDPTPLGSTPPPAAPAAQNPPPPNPPADPAGAAQPDSAAQPNGGAQGANGDSPGSGAAPEQQAKSDEGKNPDSAKPAEPPKPPVPGLLRELPRVEALFKYDTGFRADIGGARCIAFSADGTRLAIGGITNVSNAFAGVGDASIALVNMADNKIVTQMGPKEKVQGTAWGVAWHPSGCWIGLTAGGGGSWFVFWKPDQQEEFFKMKLKSDGRGLALSPDATRVAVAHADKNLRIYGLFEAPPAK